MVWDESYACDHDWQEPIPQPSRRWRSVENCGRGLSAHQRVAADDGFVRIRGQFCQRCGAWRGSLGQEPHYDLYVKHLVEIFRLVRRVLRDDGVVWLNLGDSYTNASQPGGGDPTIGKRNVGGSRYRPCVVPGLEDKNLVGIPWRVGFALQEDGWILRSDTVWAKGVSGQKQLGQLVYEAVCHHIGMPEHQHEIATAIVADLDLYVGNCMPENLSGWRWERHRIRNPDAKKVEPDPAKKQDMAGNPTYVGFNARYQGKVEPATMVCPGCEKCNPNGGFVLRKGSWRPTRAHEYVFLLAKTGRYFCDGDAVKEAVSTQPNAQSRGIKDTPDRGPRDGGNTGLHGTALAMRSRAHTTRNLRSVWTIPTRASKQAHFATFSRELITPMIKAGTSKVGCCSTCGAPWVRKIERESNPFGINGGGHAAEAGIGAVKTVGWEPSCDCHKAKRGLPEQYDRVPCTILDPFAGAGTVALVSKELGRDSISIELSEDYVAMIHKRLAESATQIDLEIEGLDDSVGRSPS